MIIEHLNCIFDTICSTLREETDIASKDIGVNPKGDVTQNFDILSEKAIKQYCEEKIKYSVCLMSEESGEISTSSETPVERWIVDPVDGSENFSRRLDLSGLSIAVLPYDLSITSANVSGAIIGNLTAGYAYLARKNSGAFDSSGNKISVSRTVRIDDALVGCDLNFKTKKPDTRVLKLLNMCKDVRRMGSTVCELMFVADGRYDAYVDIRNELTAEDFLAASLVIKEAGGVITDINGNDWGEIQNLTQPFTVLAAATPQLHVALIKLLQS